MKSYYRVMLGKNSMHAKECFAGAFIGVDYGIHEDLSASLGDQWRRFNQAYIPIYLRRWPQKSRIAAGLACGALWTVSKGISRGDVVLCPDGDGSYLAGEVLGDYYYASGQALPHRRKVRWLQTRIARSAMSESLQASARVPDTVIGPAAITRHSNEIERFLATGDSPVDSTVEDLAAFAMEQHLEAFLVRNWSQMALGLEFSIYAEDGEPVGQQYATDAGPIDILAVSKDRKRLLVIELKRGRASDVVVGQLLRYMGFVKEQIAEDGQSVEGAIIALEEDPKLRWALSAVPAVSFYRYEITFKLRKA
jgi:restriction system protein